jgi:hypothetical protein
MIMNNAENILQKPSADRKYQVPAMPLSPKTIVSSAMLDIVS